MIFCKEKVNGDSGKLRQENYKLEPSLGNSVF